MENRTEASLSTPDVDGMGSLSFLGERELHPKKVTAEWRTRHNKTECHRRKQITSTIKQLYDLLPLGHMRKKDKTSILEEVVHYLRVVYENVANIHDLEKAFIAFIAQEKSETTSNFSFPVIDHSNLFQSVRQTRHFQSPTMLVGPFADRHREEIIPLSALVYPMESGAPTTQLPCAPGEQILPNQPQYSLNSLDFFDNI